MGVQTFTVVHINLKEICTTKMIDSEKFTSTLHNIIRIHYDFESTLSTGIPLAAVNMCIALLSAAQ